MCFKLISKGAMGKLIVCPQIVEQTTSCNINIDSLMCSYLSIYIKLFAGPIHSYSVLYTFQCPVQDAYKCREKLRREFRTFHLSLSPSPCDPRGGISYCTCYWKKQLSKPEEESILSDLLNELKKSCRIAYLMSLCCTLTLIGVGGLQVKVKS